MNWIDRRRFLAAGAVSLAATSMRGQSAAEVTLTIPPEATGPHVPEDYVGLSYEVQQLLDPAIFSAHNTGLIREFKALSPKGVLRLGGNTSEFEWWKPRPESPEPKHPQTREVGGEPRAKYYPVTAESVRNLGTFVRATGWTCLYGIGMGTNTPERAATEAEYVAKALGDRLQCFQIGNEADLFSRHLRDPNTWSAKAYLDEWLAIARAVTKAVPAAQFGMPDVAADMNWLTQIAEIWPSIENPPPVTALTHHYYFGGPATNPDVNIPNLLKPATMARVQKTADTATAAANKMGVRVRMTEGNTCYRGGKPGVSDVFAAALWSADYSLLLARNNYSGVNLHLFQMFAGVVVAGSEKFPDCISWVLRCLRFLGDIRQVLVGRSRGNKRVCKFGLARDHQRENIPRHPEAFGREASRNIIIRKIGLNQRKHQPAKE